MKTLAAGLLLMGGMLLAQEPATKPQHLSADDREALASQSPSVRVHKKHPEKDKYQVTQTKNTIVATKKYTGK
jgi:hypothetical protein